MVLLFQGKSSCEFLKLICKRTQKTGMQKNLDIQF
jgi:hypothetical protein